MRRTIMQRYCDETVCEAVIVRDRNGRWVLYGVIDHSYRRQSLAEFIGSSGVLRPIDIETMVKWLCVDRAFVRMIDDAGIVHEVYRGNRVIEPGQIVFMENQEGTDKEDGIYDDGRPGTAGGSGQPECEGAGMRGDL